MKPLESKGDKEIEPIAKHKDHQIRVFKNTSRGQVKICVDCDIEVA